jgi:Na+/citrate or Na+/malate symporter
MLKTMKDPKTQQYHSATLLTIICGILAVGVLIGVIMGKLAAEYLAMFVLPIIGWGSMAWKNKNGEQDVNNK